MTAVSNGTGMVKTSQIGQSNAAKLLNKEERSTTTMEDTLKYMV